jgi:uncharacterized protein with NRDE domain
MCLLVFAHHVARDFPLLIAANRDEFHARPTAVSEFWDEHPELLAGKDLQQGGTWMGITRNGRFAAVTNYRDPARTSPAPRSRGELPLAYLTGTEDPHTYLRALASCAQEYAGFNLLVGDTQSLWYFTNSEERAPQRLAPGIYGLSNARLDTPWPKVTSGKTRLQSLLDAGEISHETLATVTASRQLADRRALDALHQVNDMEPILSAQFIVTGAYGTRSSTTLWTDTSGLASWQERSFDAEGAMCNVQERTFKIVPG